MTDELLPPVLSGMNAGEGAARAKRQATVFQWCAAAFGADHATNVEQRGLRLAEEAIEAAQAAGCDPATLHKLIDYIYAKEPGQLSQELGGVGLCVLAMAAAAGFDADDAEAAECQRVLSKPLEFFAARNKVKNDAGFVSGAYRQPVSVPDGAWKLVPVEPSEAQIESIIDRLFENAGELSSKRIVRGMARSVYALALAAAPSPSPLTDAEMREILARKYEHETTIKDAEFIRLTKYRGVVSVDLAIAAMCEVERRLMEGK